MNFNKVLSAPFRYKPWRLHHLRLILGDLTGTARQPEKDHQTHLEAAIAWLCQAQDVRNEKPDAGGVSAGWSFEDGWLPSYPETSGYIIETFIAAAEVLHRPDLLDRVQRIIDWELSIQNAEGSFPGHFGEPSSRPVIFNTGQIIHGMVAGYIHLDREECLEAAVSAGHWMVACQDEDGCWRKNVHQGVPHTYNTRAAWALLRTALIAEDPTLKQAAIRNLDWALTQQTENGWFATNAFTPDKIPFTHTIAYAIRGLLESGLLLGDERYIASAEKAAMALARAQREDGWLAGTYDNGWVPKAGYCCLTGLAQTTIIWQRLGQARGTSELQLHIDRALRYLKQCHRTTPYGRPEAGGVAGSAPIWGRYSMFEFPNWAAKFFADALMMEMKDITIPMLLSSQTLSKAAVSHG
ncbi:prenyltransferase/squalene oxidase repeat-containing protein [Nitrosococcus wardiae]|uniref:Squalene cyclase C-terminal domain-containing protein n=1 Tax=Nitrosococcus wardiae TaxID=1814290 RepID=A0A4P7BYR4_9GAMM|nr:prenyltransferase/squalene oxidase repeat-containing protein [Nitrosococcus wardiae]QBQ54487.1 hypothetical protein E3U44_08195 [Nitrosococcus wardiae]